MATNQQSFEFPSSETTSFNVNPVDSVESKEVSHDFGLATNAVEQRIVSQFSDFAHLADTSLIPSIRPQVISVLTFTAGQSVGTITTPVSLFSEFYNRAIVANGALGAFANYTFDLSLRFVVAGGPQFSGLVKFGLDYGRNWNESFPVSFESIMSSVGPLVDFSQRSEPVLEVPFIAPSGVATVVSHPFTSTHVCNLRAVLVSGLASSLGAGASVRVSIVATPVNVRAWNAKGFSAATITPEATALVPIDGSHRVLGCGTIGRVAQPVSSFVGNMGFAARFAWSATTDVGTELFSTPAHPAFYPESPVGIYALNHAKFRGGLRFRITVPFDGFTTGSIYFAVVPVGSTIDSENFESYPGRLVDFGDSHSADCVVRYSGGTSWYPVFSSSDSTNELSPSRLVAIVVAPLTSSSLSSVEGIIEVCGASDFECFCPRSPLYRVRPEIVLEADELNTDVPRPSAHPQPYLSELLSTFTELGIVELSPLAALPVSPLLLLARNQSLLSNISSHYLGWRGSLKFRFIAEGNAQYEVRHDPLFVPSSPSQKVDLKALSAPEVTLDRFADLEVFDSRVNPTHTLLVPFSSFYDFCYVSPGPATKAQAFTTSNGSLIFSGKGAVRVLIAAGPDFELIRYNHVRALAQPSATTTVEADVPVVEGLVDSIVPEHVKLLLSMLSGSVKNVAESSNNIKITAELCKKIVELFSPGVEFLSSFVSTFSTFKDTLFSIIKCFIPESLTAGMPTVAQYFPGKFECLVLSAITFVVGFVFDVRNNAVKITAALIGLFGMIAADENPRVTNLLQTILAELASASLRKESTSPVEAVSEATLPKILCVLIAALVPVASGVTLGSAGKIGRDLQGLFNGSKSVKEMYGLVMDWVLGIPLIREHAVNFNILSAHFSFDFPAFIAEAKYLNSEDVRILPMNRHLRERMQALLRKEVEVRLFGDRISGLNFLASRLLTEALKDCREIASHLTHARGQGMDRPAPFFWLLSGETRVGKSVFATHLMKSLANSLGYDENSAIYVKNSGSKYYDGYNHQWGAYLDDLHTVQHKDPQESDIATIMAMHSCTEYKLPMARLEEKGICFDSLFIGATTNIPGDVSMSGIRNGEAYFTRINSQWKMHWRPEANGQYSHDFTHAYFTRWTPGPSPTIIKEHGIIVHYSAQELMEIVANQYCEYMLKQAERARAQKTNLASIVPAETAQSVRRAQDFLSGNPIEGSVSSEYEDALPTHMLPLEDRDLALMEDLVGREGGTDLVTEYRKCFTLTNGVLEHRDVEETEYTDIVRCVADKYFPVGDELEEVSLDPEDAATQALDSLKVVEGEIVFPKSLNLLRKYFTPSEESAFARGLKALGAAIRPSVPTLMMKDAFQAEVEDGGKGFSLCVALAGAVVAGVCIRKAYTYFMPEKTQKEPAVTRPIEIQSVNVGQPAQTTRRVKVQSVNVGQPTIHTRKVVPQSVNVGQPLQVTRKVVAQAEDDRVVELEPVDRAVELEEANTITLVAPEADFEVAHIRKQARRISLNGVSLNGLFVDANHILCNFHLYVLAKPTFPARLVIIEGDSVITFELDADKFCRIGAKDLMLIRVPAYRGMRKMFGSLATRQDLEFTMSRKGLLLTTSKDGSPLDYALSDVSQRVASDKQVFHASYNMDASSDAYNATTVVAYGFWYFAPTRPGDCGAPLVISATPNKVSGLHCAHSYSVFVIREEIEDALANWCPAKMPETLPDLPIEECSALTLWKAACSLTPEASQPNLFVGNLSLPIVGVTSPADALPIYMSSKIRKSPLASYLPFPATRIRAILSSSDTALSAKYQEDGIEKRKGFCEEPYEPLVRILDKYSTPIAPLDPEIVQEVVTHLASLIRALTPSDFPLANLDLHDSLNGLPSVPYFDPVNLDASPGILFAKKGYRKKRNLVKGDVPNLEPLEILTDEFEAALYDEDYKCLFQEFLKDELLKPKKVLQKPATRGIANPNFGLVTAVRSRFLPFCALLSTIRTHFDCQVGLNVHSAHEWTHMIESLLAKSPIGFAADYSAFDATIHAQTLRAFVDIVNLVVDDGEEEAARRHRLAAQSYDRDSQVGNIIVHISQGMASGMPFTAVGNSMVNSIYLRYCWLVLAREHGFSYDLNDFEKFVRAVTYGDDNVVAIDADVVSWYNLRSVARTLAPFGLSVTDDKKNPIEKVEPYVQISTATFLKRSFVKDQLSGWYKGPLPLGILIDMIRYTRQKEQTQEDLDGRMQSLYGELLYHGPKIFRLIDEMLRQVQRSAGLIPFHYSYDTAYRAWAYQYTMKLSMEASNVLSFSDGRQRWSASSNARPELRGESWVLNLSRRNIVPGETLNQWITLINGASSGQGSSVGLSEADRQLLAQGAFTAADRRLLQSLQGGASATGTFTAADRGLLVALQNGLTAADRALVTQGAFTQADRMALNSLSSSVTQTSGGLRADERTALLALKNGLTPDDRSLVTANGFKVADREQLESLKKMVDASAAKIDVLIKEFREFVESNRPPPPPPVTAITQLTNGTPIVPLNLVRGNDWGVDGTLDNVYILTNRSLFPNPNFQNSMGRFIPNFRTPDSLVIPARNFNLGFYAIYICIWARRVINEDWVIPVVSISHVNFDNASFISFGVIILPKREGGVFGDIHLRGRIEPETPTVGYAALAHNRTFNATTNLNNDFNLRSGANALRLYLHRTSRDVLRVFHRNVDALSPLPDFSTFNFISVAEGDTLCYCDSLVSRTYLEDRFGGQIRGLLTADPTASLIPLATAR